MAYFRFENKNIYFEESGNGSPLLILHGNTASSKMYADVAARYASEYKVILIDFLGHGKSDRLEAYRKSERAMVSGNGWLKANYGVDYDSMLHGFFTQQKVSDALQSMMKENIYARYLNYE